MNVSTLTSSRSNGNTGGSALSPFSSLESPEHESVSHHRVQPKQRFPPMEIDVVQRRSLALCKSGNSKDPKPFGMGSSGRSNWSSGRSNWSSGRSIASSITFCDDFSFEVGDKDAAFEPALFTTDSRPDLPKRQGSGYLKACKEEEGAPDDGDNDEDDGSLIRDSPPNKPRRRLSFASMASSIAGSTLSSSRKSSRSKSSSSENEGASAPKHTFTPASSSLLPTFSPLFTTTSEEFKDRTNSDSTSTDQVLKQLAQKAATFRKLVEVKHRKYAMRTFKSCFVGSEAVDVMLKAELARTRDEAVQLGRDMIRYLQLFQHVTQGHNFKDKVLFYRFMDDETHCSGASGAAAVVSDCGDSLSSSNHQRSWFAFRRTRTIEEESPLSQDDLQRVPPIINSNGRI